MATTDSRTSSGAIADIDALVRPSRLRRLAWLTALLVVVGGGTFLGYRRWFQPAPVVPPTITEVQVTRGPLASTLSTSGSAAAGQSAALAFGTGGRVTGVSVRVGDAVKAGQELARVDDRDARRKLETAELSLSGARTRLAQLTAPATDSEVQGATQSIIGAEAQLATARATLEKLLRPPLEVDVQAGDATLQQARNSLETAELNVKTTYGLALAAQNVLCTNHSVNGVRCGPDNIPLAPDVVELLGFYTGLTGPNVSQALPGAARDLISANTSYVNATLNLANAKTSLASAELKRAEISKPVDPLDIAQAQFAVTSAEASLGTTKAKETELRGGPTSFEVELAQESVRSAEIALQAAKDALDDTVLRAPFDASVSAVALNVGAQSASPAVTINNPAAIRVDLTISESDLPSLRVGQFGLALFDALPGRPVIVRIRGISTLPTVSQGVVSYPVQAEIVTGEALREARESLASLVQGNAGAFRGLAQGAGGAAGAGAPGAGGPGAGAGAGGGPRGAGGAGGGAGRSPGSTDEAGNLPSPGMNASITVLLRVEQDALQVPNSAIKRVNRQQVVTIKNEAGGQEEVPVTTSTTNGSSTIITEGLTEGQTVLIISAAPSAAATAAAKTATGGTQTIQVGPAGPGGFGGGGVR